MLKMFPAATPISLYFLPPCFTSYRHHQIFLLVLISPTFYFICFFPSFLFSFFFLLCCSVPPLLISQGPWAEGDKAPWPHGWWMTDTSGLCPSRPVSGFFPCNTLLFLLLLVGLHFSMEHDAASRQSGVLRSAFCSINTWRAGLVDSSQGYFHGHSLTFTVEAILVP